MCTCLLWYRCLPFEWQISLVTFTVGTCKRAMILCFVYFLASLYRLDAKMFPTRINHKHTDSVEKNYMLLSLLAFAINAGSRKIKFWACATGCGEVRLNLFLFNLLVKEKSSIWVGIAQVTHTAIIYFTAQFSNCY